MSTAASTSSSACTALIPFLFQLRLPSGTSDEAMNAAHQEIYFPNLRFLRVYVSFYRDECLLRWAAAALISTPPVALIEI